LKWYAGRIAEYDENCTQFHVHFEDGDKRWFQVSDSSKYLVNDPVWSDTQVEEFRFLPSLVSCFLTHNISKLPLTFCTKDVPPPKTRFYIPKVFQPHIKMEFSSTNFLEEIEELAHTPLRKTILTTLQEDVNKLVDKYVSQNFDNSRLEEVWKWKFIQPVVSVCGHLWSEFSESTEIIEEETLWETEAPIKLRIQITLTLNHDFIFCPLPSALLSIVQDYYGANFPSLVPIFSSSKKLLLPYIENVLVDGLTHSHWVQDGFLCCCEKDTGLVCVSAVDREFRFFTPSCHPV
jgi:hypothetical protein